MAFSKPQPLDVRIREIQAEANAFIDRMAAEIAKECPGVPAASVRISITRGLSCACHGALLAMEGRDNDRAA